MTESNYKNYRVRYLANHQVTPAAFRDAVNPNLWVCEDLLPALTADAALQQVIIRGGIPVSAKLVRVGSSKISDDYKLKFLMAILFAVQSGVSVGAAMERVINSEPWPLRGQLEPAMRLLQSGSSFSESLSLLGMYDETTMAMLSAGEQTGTMQQSLSTSLLHLKRKSTADGLMKGAITMILIDISMALSSSLSAVFGLLPQAQKQGLQTKDPLALAQYADAIEFGYVLNWLLIGGAMVALFFVIFVFFGYQHGNAETRVKVEGYLRKLPFLGSALVHDAVSVSTSIAGHLLKGGVLFTSAVEITSRTIRVPSVRNYWLNVLNLTLLGAPVSSSLAKEPLTNAEIRVVASHTSSAQLAEAFAQISEFRMGLASKANKRFVTSGLIASFIYSGLGIGATLYVNYVQITGMMTSVSS